MNNELSIQILRQRHGFTLPELLVSMGLFLIVISIASGAFIQALRTQRAAVELMAVNDNASETLEQMAREIRTGFGFQSPNSGELRFANYLDQAVVYRFNAGKNAIEKSIDGGINFEALTASNIKIQRLSFAVIGGAAGDGSQTRVVVSAGIGGKTKSLEGVVTNIQTTVSPRLLDN